MSQGPAQDGTRGLPDILIVIPTFNERENIGSLVDALMEIGAAPRLLVVDDNSPDGTGQEVERLAVRYPGRVALLSRSSKQGIGRAYIAGFEQALAGPAELIVQMDADHSHAPDDLVRMLAVARATDLVLASRYVPGGSTQGWPWHRRLISRAGGWYAGLILGIPIRDFTGGFKVWHRRVLESIELSSIHSDGYCFQIETTYRAIRQGFRYEQVPITFHDRVAGKSKLSRRVVIEAALVIWQLRARQLLGRPW